MASGADRISGLPEGVLHYILSLLPARDAVRTCVLAQSWRNRWRSAPALRFSCPTGWDGSVDAFRHFVDSLLRARRRCPPLESCDFDLDVDQTDVDLDLHGSRWIRQVLKLKVRELRFRLCEYKLFQFPLRHLSSQHLTSLELSGVIDPDGKLDFSEMNIPSLKNLSIKNCFFDSKYRTRMSLPSLISFEFINNSGRTPMLETMPYLETAKVFYDGSCDDRCENGRLDDCGDPTCEACFNYYVDPDDDSGSVFLHGLAEATYLNLSAYPDMYVFNRDMQWCPAFNKLKTLVLSKWFLSTDLSGLIWFLHHTPLLEKLTLEFPEDDVVETEGSYNPLEKSIASSLLQTVEVICKDVDVLVLKVLKVLNANGIELGKIRIQCSGCYDFVCTNIKSV